MGKKSIFDVFGTEKQISPELCALSQRHGVRTAFLKFPEAVMVTRDVVRLTE